MSAWSAASAQIMGPGKSRIEDACLLMPQCSRMIAVIADGAGSAKHAAEGAGAAVRAAAELMAQWSGEPVLSLNRSHAVQLCRAAGQAAARAAEAQGGRAEDGSCTLLAALLDSEGLWTMQVGDGAWIIDRGPLGFEAAVWPEATGFANQTWFVTSPGAERRVYCRRAPGPIQALFGFSDGIQGLVLEESARRIHAPFFQAISGRLPAPAAGADAAASEALQQLLASSGVRDRAGDDITLAVIRSLHG
jgi:hypothetical protein